MGASGPPMTSVNVLNDKPGVSEASGLGSPARDSPWPHCPAPFVAGASRSAIHATLAQMLQAYFSLLLNRGDLPEAGRRRSAVLSDVGDGGAGGAGPARQPRRAGCRRALMRRPRADLGGPDGGAPYRPASRTAGREPVHPHIGLLATRSVQPRRMVTQRPRQRLPLIIPGRDRSAAQCPIWCAPAPMSPRRPTAVFAAAPCNSRRRRAKGAAPAAPTPGAALGLDVIRIVLPHLVKLVVGRGVLGRRLGHPPAHRGVAHPLLIGSPPSCRVRILRQHQFLVHREQPLLDGRQRPEGNDTASRLRPAPLSLPDSTSTARTTSRS